MENQLLDAQDVDVLLTTALRDFFVAKNAADMRKALAGLPSGMRPDCSREMDWERTEFAFNRLFVGPMALEAPPYASVYLEDEPQVMGRTTMLVRSVYETFGLVSPWKNTVPDDHVSLELDAVLAMRQMALVAGPTILAQLKELRRIFLEEHILIWMPKFCDRMENAASADPVLRSAAASLRHWLGTDIARGA